MTQTIAHDLELRSRLNVELEKIEALGSSEQIAQFMSGLEITGQPGNGRLCVMAQYLNRTLPGQWNVGSLVFGQDPPYRFAMATTPPTVLRFVLDFDACRFPELVSYRVLPFA